MISGKQISSFFQHPAVLLIIGFALTGIIGAWLTGRWQRNEWDRQQFVQSQEWDRQQLRLLDIHSIDLKYEIINEITKSIGERNAAATGIVVPLLGGISDRELIKEEQEPIKNWQKVSHDWRTDSQILRLKIAAHIKSQEAADLFTQLIKTEKEFGGKVTYLQKHLDQYNRLDNNAEAQKYLDGILNDIEKIGKDLKQLVTVIADETRDDVKGTKP